MKRSMALATAAEAFDPPTTIMHGQTDAGDDLLIRAMIHRLPPPGANWPHRDRLEWLDGMRHAFTLIYRDKN